MNDPVETAKIRLAEIEEEAEKLRLFIAAWESVADILGDRLAANPEAVISVDNPVSDTHSDISRRARAVNPPTDEIVAAAIQVLRHRGHPMSRRALHEALWERGVQVRGTDPVKTLGTILWRAGDRIIQLEGYGYWPKHISYTRAGYFQPSEALVSPAAPENTDLVLPPRPTRISS